MAIVLEFRHFTFVYDGESLPLFTASFESGDMVALLLSRDLYDRALLNFLHLNIINYDGDAMFLGEAFNAFNEKMAEDWRKNFHSISLIFPMISNLKMIENVYLPIFYRENIQEEVIFKKAYDVLFSLGIDKKYNVLPAFLSNFEKKLALFARARLLEPAIIYYSNIFNDMDEEKKRFFSKEIINFHKEKNDRITIITFRSEKEFKDIEELKFNKIIKL